MANKSKKLKALVLFSGGLDSRLVVKLMQERGYEVECINFILPFGTGCCNSHCSLNFCQKESVKMKRVDCTSGELLQEYLEIIRKPKFGRGSCLNPCIDCKIFMFKKAKEYADKNKIGTIVTGEVKGQRPMSQTSKALEKIDTALGFEITRPLIELGIEGRKRDKQIEMAHEFGIEFPQPAGGCLLCEPEFCKRLKPILNNFEEIDVELLKIGRHFENSNIVLGRNEQENNMLEEIQKKFNSGFLIVPEQPGATAFIKKKEYEEKGKELIRKYSKHKIERFDIL